MDYIPILLGWPAIVIAVGLAILGCVRKSWWWLAMAAALTAPVSLYLALNPIPGLVALLVPAGMSASAVSIWHGRRPLAMVLLLPPAAVLVYVAVRVLGE